MVLTEATEDVSVESEWVQDVLEIITVRSARWDGSRSHKPKKLGDCLQEMHSVLGRTVLSVALNLGKWLAMMGLALAYIDPNHPLGGSGCLQDVSQRG